VRSKDDISYWIKPRECICISMSGPCVRGITLLSIKRTMPFLSISTDMRAASMSGVRAAPYRIDRLRPVSGTRGKSRPSCLAKAICPLSPSAGSTETAMMSVLAAIKAGRSSRSEERWFAHPPVKHLGKNVSSRFFLPRSSDNRRTWPFISITVKAGAGLPTSSFGVGSPICLRNAPSLAAF
jgi:hypothetical protein